ncbi:MAG: ABC transporter substrate-binding protein [Gammaproteobacteria bacterium]|nr:ABC transporter substrate-binding protein [Gammaproteobacteria bacterium]MBU1415981.1 ABC transporter substrate-binding protein [Gammaproteobacteria bacterium]
MKLKPVAAGLIAAFAVSFAYADINVGVTVSATGPAASLGIPEKNTFALMPTTIAGQKINYIILDDASDTTSAVKNIRKFVTEDKVDVVVGSTITPNSLAMIDVAAEAETPMISMAASSRIVDTSNPKVKWVFKTPQNDVQMSSAIVESMLANKVQTVGFIGFADAYGEGWYNEFSKIAEARNLKIVASERYNRGDTSVTGQVLKIMAARPDAVLVAGAGTPAALPQKTLKERGYSGLYYQTHGVANKDFIRVCGADCEGTLLPAGPVLVAAQLPDSNPIKKVAMDYTNKYEATYGKGTTSTFGAHAADAVNLLAHAIPVALKTAKPGTKEFRAALRDAIEGLKDVTNAHGIVNMSPTDHLGFDQRSRVMVKIESGAWKLQ